MILHAVGNDIAEAAEWQRPILLGIPMHKMLRKEGEAGPVFTEGCDLLIPNVGVIVGAYTLIRGYTLRTEQSIKEDR